MAGTNNYLIRAEQAKKHFLTCDQEKLIDKFQLQFDEVHLYVNILCKPYRINRKTGDMEYLAGEIRHGDEEFAPRLRYLWDANAKMYIRYETMYVAVGLLEKRLREHM